MAIEKIKILGAVLELPAKQHCQFSLFTSKMGKWAELAVVFSWQLQDFNLSIAMGADYSFELISIETYASQFIGHNKIFLGSV